MSYTENSHPEASTETEIDATHTLATPEETEPSENALPQNPNAEAAKYRTQLREAERQRDALAVRIEAFQRAEVLRLAADLAQPEDLFTVGDVTLTDMLDDEGGIDAEKVSAAVADLLESRPGLHRQARHPAAQRYPNFGQSGGPYRNGSGNSLTWSQALKAGR